MKSRIQNTEYQGYKINEIKDTEHIESRIQNTWNQEYSIQDIRDT